MDHLCTAGSLSSFAWRRGRRGFVAKVAINSHAKVYTILADLAET